MVALAVALALVRTREPDGALARELDAVLAAPELRGASIGVRVEDPDGRTLYARGDALRLMPASNEKLLTCAYALDVLGPDFRPTTEFWRARGGLVVKANGDALMTPARLRAVQRKLNPRRGPVTLVEAFRPGYLGDWELGDLPNRYAAPIYALTLDRASLELWVVDGRPALRPAGSGVRIVRTDRGGPLVDRFDPFARVVRLGGKLPAGSKRLDTLSLPRADAVAAALLGRGLRFGTKTPNRRPDLVLRGPPLRETMTRCLQTSDNELAETFLLLAGRARNAVDPYPEALASLRRFLAGRVGLGAEEASPADGSGLSRHDVVTAAAVVKLLRWSLAGPRAGAWRAMLDHPGVGTLARRLAGVQFQGKTGTAGMVSALSGYLQVRGRTYVVSILLNDFPAPATRVKAIEDEFIRKLASNLRSGTPLARG